MAPGRRRLRGSSGTSEDLWGAAAAKIKATAGTVNSFPQGCPRGAGARGRVSAQPWAPGTGVQSCRRGKRRRSRTSRKRRDLEKTHSGGSGRACAELTRPLRKLVLGPRGPRGPWPRRSSRTQRAVVGTRSAPSTLAMKRGPTTSGQFLRSGTPHIQEGPSQALERCCRRPRLPRRCAQAAPADRPGGRLAPVGGPKLTAVFVS